MKLLNIKKIVPVFFASTSLFMMSNVFAQTNLLNGVTYNDTNVGTAPNYSTYTAGGSVNLLSYNTGISYPGGVNFGYNGGQYSGLTIGSTGTYTVSFNFSGGSTTQFTPRSPTGSYAPSSGIALYGLSSASGVSPVFTAIVPVAITSAGRESISFNLTSTNPFRLIFLNFDTTAYTLSDLSLVYGSVVPTGPSLENTQASVQNTAQALQGTYTLQNSVLANSFSYDCTVFGENNVCVSAGGRNTAVSAANGLNNTSALLIAAYRAMANVRVGAYADQNLSVNNGGSTVNLGNNTPLLGLFAAWNENLDGTGTEVKATIAYGQKNTTMNRSVVGTGATASEAGSGSSTLNSQGAQVTAKYGFGVADQVIVSPYVGIRYTQNNMGGYTEATSTSVTTPLTYSALNTNATTALAGVGASYRGIPQTTLFASAGVETDTNTANGSYNATGLTGLAPVNFNPNPVKTRPTAMLGASYDVEKNQRLGVTGIYRQEAYQATASTTVMATYTVGF